MEVSKIIKVERNLDLHVVGERVTTAYVQSHFAHFALKTWLTFPGRGLV